MFIAFSLDEQEKIKGGGLGVSKGSERFALYTSPTPDRPPFFCWQTRQMDASGRIHG